MSGSPYDDRVIALAYSYSDNDMDQVSEVDDILASFSVDMDAIELSIVDEIVNDDFGISITNPLSTLYLSDGSYEYDGLEYLSATFGKKDDYDFYASVYANTYWDDSYIGDFDAFEKDTMSDAEEWYEIVTKGDIKIDGHDGFFYTEEYDWDGDVTYYTTIYVFNDEDSYIGVSYSGTEESYNSGINDFKKILKAVKLDNGGDGQYVVPSFLSASTTLVDIDHYIYEENIKSLNSDDAFGEDTPESFNPAGELSREDYVVWAVRTLTGDVYNEFEEFEANYSGCGEVCFKDVNYDSGNAHYIEFARNKGAIGASENFSPDAQISLMAALKVIFELYDYDVWQAPEFVSWYVPYLHLGYKEGVIPYGVDGAGYLLTRGEGVYIIDGVMSSQGDDYYYDDDYFW